MTDRRRSVALALAALLTTIALVSTLVSTGPAADAAKPGKQPISVTLHGFRGVHLGEPVSKAAKRLHIKAVDHCGQYKTIDVHRFIKDALASLVTIDNHYSGTGHRVSEISLIANPFGRTPRASGPRGVKLGMTVKAAQRAWGHKFKVRKTDGVKRYWVRAPHKRIVWFTTGRVTNAQGIGHDHRIASITLASRWKVAVAGMASQGGC